MTKLKIANFTDKCMESNICSSFKLKVIQNELTPDRLQDSQTRDLEEIGKILNAELDILNLELVEKDQEIVEFLKQLPSCENPKLFFKQKLKNPKYSDDFQTTLEKFPSEFLIKSKIIDLM